MTPGLAALDTWTLVHVLAGVVLGLIRTRWAAAVALVVGWEIVEAGLRQIRPGGAGIFEYESMANILVDVVVGVIGWATGRAWPAASAPVGTRVRRPFE